MNGNAKKAVHVVDGIIEKKNKAKRINKQLSRKLNHADDWGFVPSSYLVFLKMVWNIVLIPVVLVVAVLEAVRAGFIAGMQKALAMYR
jgi:ABC-type uncharacterized transport system involved in gliding motility auxiliary subunit